MRRALLLALALLAPAALAQPEPDPGDADAERKAAIVTFYPHVFGIGTGAPMPGNTQFPSGEDDFSRGTNEPCFGDLASCDANTASVLYVYSTAGFVHADFDTFSYEQIHNERGQAKDILLDTTQDITATFYMSADWHGWVPSTVVGERLGTGLPSGMPVWNWDPGVQPDWQVEATLYLAHLGEYQGQASEAPPVHEMLTGEGGTLVAQGVSAPLTMVSLDETLNGGQGEVHEFEVNLGKAQVDRIPKEADWVMRFRWWSLTNDNRYQIPLNWNVNSGEFYPNRFALPVRNPFDVELVYPQFLHDKLLLHAMLNSPWGSYDVDSKSVQLDIVDSSNRPVQPQRMSRSADFSVAHGGHYKPVNLTWVWDHRADALPPGTYQATVTASNFQHSATSSTTASFRINPDGSGTVLSVGRSGQQTFTEAQLRSLEATGDEGNLTIAAAPAPPAPAPSRTPAVELGLALLVLGGVALGVRRR